MNAQHEAELFSSLPEPTPAQRAWMELGYGMFLHFGPNTFAGQAWGEGNFPAEEFAPQKLDPRGWARVAAEAGMRYAVLTAKHHDGFCLWPSNHTSYCVKNAGITRDVVGEFVVACRESGVKPGLYYSLWDRNFPDYEDNALYAAYMRAQITELLTLYGPLVELWFDGGWDKEFPARSWQYDPEREGEVAPDILNGARWGWKELYTLIHELQPDCLVFNNSSSNRPGVPRYRSLLLDGRTAEHFDFVYNEHLCQPNPQTVWTSDAGEAKFLPLEFCTSLNPDWFWTGRDHYLHPSPETIAGWHDRARGAGANLLLNVGPNRDGLVPDYHRTFLLKAKALMKKEASA